MKGYKVRAALYEQSPTGNSPLLKEHYFASMSDALVWVNAYYEAYQWEDIVVSAIVITELGSEYDPEFDADSEVGR